MRRVRVLALAAALAVPAAAAAQQVSASALLGAVVLGPLGARLGHVTDLAVDVENAQVRYAMVLVPAQSPLSGPGDEMHGVPLHALRPAMQRDHLVLDEHSMTLPSAPANARMARASTLIGMRAGPEETISDLLIDLPTGRVEAAVVKARDERATIPFPLAITDPRR